MDFQNLIPNPEAIPAPVWLLMFLEQLTFLLHIVVINIVLGAGLLVVASKFFNKGNQLLTDPANQKLPGFIAIGINFGVAPLLFLQVIYGNLFYTSSILMANYWILIIPILILAYYASYYFALNGDKNEMLGKFSIALSMIFILYIGFMFVNNNSMMERPEGWSAYFSERGGTILGTSDFTIYPRYLHFIVASFAVGGLFFAVIWHLKKENVTEVEKSERISKSLRIFAIATTVQVFVGIWYLISQPNSIMMLFMGNNLLYTIILMIGILTAVLSIITSFSAKLIPTVALFLLTIIAMIISRVNLRSAYLEDNFSLSGLELTPQYDVLALFIIILLIGVGSVAYMVNISIKSNERRIAL